MIKNKVAIIGLGYVGLPLACVIANNNQYQVVGFDIDPKKIDQTRKKKSPIEDELTERLLPKVTLEVSSNPSIINEAEFILVCVPTPVNKKKLPNLTPLKDASQIIKQQLSPGQTIIIESTINPGICEEVILPILEKSGLKGGEDFELSHCPERINPGDRKWNTLNIPRNIGSLTEKGNKKSANFYRSFLKCQITELSCLKAAEASKVIENTFRDINIAYVNELAQSFDLMGIDLLEVIKAASNKPFAFMPHFPSCGVGGHCIPVDPYYLIMEAKKSGFNHSFLRKARKVNESMPKYTIKLFKSQLKKLKKKIHKQKVGLLGLSYKSDVGDLRESPSLRILEILKKKKAQVKTFDPYFTELSDFKNLNQILEYSDSIILCTNHKDFLKINGQLLKKHGVKLVIDGKNCLNKKDISNNDILYKGIGH